MTDKTPHDILQEVLQHLDADLEILDGLIKTYDQQGFDDPVRFRKRLLQYCDKPDVPKNKKIKRIARGMKTLALLCRIDDLHNDLRCLRDNLAGLVSNERVSSSDIPFWREVHRESMATFFLLGRELDGE